MGSDFFFIKHFISGISNFIYQSINYLSSIVFRVIIIFYLSVNSQFNYNLLEISIYILFIIFFIKTLLIVCEPFLLNSNYSNYSVDKYYKQYIINIYLSTIYLINYGINYNYMKGLFYIYFIKLRIFFRDLFYLTNYLGNIKSFWYPLFKKYSYFGYSRFTKYTTNYKK